MAMVMVMVGAVIVTGVSVLESAAYYTPIGYMFK